MCRQDEEAIEALLALLEGDKSKDVRAAVVQALPLTAGTLPAVLRRARDVSPLVRKALVLRLRSLPLTVLSIEQRASAIQQLLRDRDAGVAEAASKLLAHWLDQDCGGDPLQLLQLLDVETHTDAAVLAVEGLIASDSIKPPAGQPVSGAAASGATAYIRAAAAAGSGSSSGLMGLRQLAASTQADQLLPPHQALMW